MGPWRGLSSSGHVPSGAADLHRPRTLAFHSSGCLTPPQSALSAAARGRLGRAYGAPSIQQRSSQRAATGGQGAPIQGSTSGLPSPSASKPSEQGPQSRGGATAKVALFTGAYITVAGVALLLFPQRLFALLFPASAVGLGWIRVGATLAVLFGAYYLGAAVDDMEGRKPLRMYQATILGRALLAAVFCGLVAGGQCGAGLLLLAAANAAGAWRMGAALRSDGVRWGWDPTTGGSG